MNFRKCLLFVFFIVVSNLSVANWTDLNTGINDDLTGLVFRGDTGVVSGHKGLYFTLNGGIGSSSWTRFDIVGNTSDSIVYNNTRFNHCYADQNDQNLVFACGTDTVNGRAVIFQLSLNAFSDTLLYLGPTGSSLNNIDYCSTYSDYFAVGGNGHIVRFDINGNVSVESSGLSMDLRAISFSNEIFWLATNGFDIRGNITAMTINISTNVPTPNDDLYDVSLQSSNSGLGVGDKAYSLNNNILNSHTNYAFSQLNANCIKDFFGVFLVGTSQGIFRYYDSGSSISNHFLEWAPSSGQNEIHELWKEQSANGIYACGKNGTVLYTNTIATKTKPYVTLSGEGGCANSYITINGSTGSGYNYSHFVNGVFVSSNYPYLSTFYSTAGVYEVQLIADNFNFGSGYSDTATIYITVVDPPVINKSVTILDSILCHAEPIDIQIDSSQADVYYTLFDYANQNTFGSSPIGNGNTISFTSNVLSDSGYYYIHAEHTLANCSSDFTDSIRIDVEKTTANFHVGRVNEEVGSPVPFYEHCRDADNYLWTFESNAALGVSNLADPISNYVSMGAASPVQLICWSTDGCYDSITKNGATIVSENLNYDSCWVNIGSGIDPPWPGSLNERISTLTKATDGLLISGFYDDNQTFPSQLGDQLQLSGPGGYVMKYDHAGMIKWFIKADAKIESVIEDHQGNFYIAADGISEFIDNKGDTVNFSYADGSLIKLDSLGGMIWYRSGSEFRPYKVSVDHGNNVYVSFQHDDNWQSTTPTYITFNGVPDDSLGVYAPNEDYGLFKMSPTGAILWDIVIKKKSFHSHSLETIEFDDANNLYLSSSFGSHLIFYEPGGTIEEVSYIGTPWTSFDKTFVAKIDSNGNIIWINNQRCTESYGTVDGWAMAIDDNGNTYLSGRSSSSSQNPLVSVNPNNSTVTSENGPFFLLKLDSNGTCQWVRGTQYSLDHANTGGHRVALYDDEIYVIGNSLGGTGEFHNSDSTVLSIPLDTYDYFVIVYDSNGIAKRAFKNGQSPMAFMSSAHPMTGFLVNDDGTFYLSRVWQMNPSSSPFNEFGTTITSTDEYEGWLTKFKEGCGVDFQPHYQYEVNAIACIGELVTFPNGQVITASASISDTSFFIASSSVDSLIITNLTVNLLPDTQVSVIGITSLYADINGAQYQWLDCDNGFSPVIGETNQAFNALANGNYAVEITGANGCSDTSSCYAISHVELHESEINEISVFPNPTSGEVNIKLRSIGSYDLKLEDALGRLIERKKIENSDSFKLKIEGDSGIYFLSIKFQENEPYRIKLIKN